MHKYLILFFSVTLFCCGCTSKSVPRDIIQPDAMAGLLVQIHLIDGTLYNRLQTPDSLYKYGMGDYLEAFRKFNTDSAQFKKSMVYYANDLDKFSQVYDQVDVKMKALSDSVNLVQTKERAATHKADSIKAVALKKQPAKKSPLTEAQKADSVKQYLARRKMDVKIDSAIKAKQKHKLDSAAKAKTKSKLDAIKNKRKLRMRPIMDTGAKTNFKERIKHRPTN